MKKEIKLKAWGLYEEELLIVEPYFTKEKMKLTYEHENEKCNLTGLIKLW